MKKVVVTGGAGFIGSNLVDELLGKGCEVIILDDLSTGKKENINKNATFVHCDISKTVEHDGIDYVATQYFDNVDVIFHLAALARVQPSIDNPRPYNEANVTGTMNLLFAAHKAGVKKVVYSASSSCYGDTEIFPTPEDAPKNPLSPYGVQKYIGEIYCKMFSEVYGLDTCSLRYFNVYGPRMAQEGAYALVLAIWQRQFNNGEPLTITNDGHQTRDFTHVSDVVQANVLAAEHPVRLNGEAFNVGNGDTISINDVSKMINSDAIYSEKRLEPRCTHADNTKIKEVLGWEPRGDLQKFIEDTFK